YWSGERVSSREYLFFNEHPVSWGDQHPECRNRFGFWSDGTRMDPKEFNEVIGGVFERDVFIGIIKQQRSRTPEEIARDNWAHDVRERTASCEEAQWMPIVKENAIRKERIDLAAFAFLPPIILFITVAAFVWI